MKKIFFLSALLCASMVSFATQYCEAELTDLNAGETNNQNLIFTASKTGDMETTFILTSTTSTLTGLFEAVFQIPGGGATDTDWKDWTLTDGALSKVVTWTTYPTSAIQLHLVARRDNSQGGSDIIGKTITDIDVSAACAGSDELANPELTLNETEVALDAAESETFQIVATRQGEGAISFESSNAGIASVTDEGLVTAVGRGKATITVRVEATETHAAASKTLKVTVSGPVNWEAVEWLAGSDNKYKVVTEPEISNNFGGKHVENGNLWIGFPSAVWGDNSSVEHSAVGAGVSFPLSQFPNEFNDFNFICDGVTYTITLFYVDGIQKPTAVDNILTADKAVKVIENGQIMIIKNGVRFNALGQQMQ